MSTPVVTVEGIVKPDGTVEIAEKVDLPPGKVQVTLVPLPGVTPGRSVLAADAEDLGRSVGTRPCPRSVDEVESDAGHSAKRWRTRFRRPSGSRRNAAEPASRQARQGNPRMIAYLDANIVIYVVEQHPVWGAGADARIAQLRAAGDPIAVSDAHRLECLVGPMILNDLTTLADYFAFFNDPELIAAPLVARVWERAALHPRRAQLQAARFAPPGCRRRARLRIVPDQRRQLRRFPDITVEVLA